MAGRELHYRFEWQLDASPDALWPLVADTNRFNHETGAPEVAEEGDGEAPPSSGRRRLRISVLGREIPYSEEPFEWVRPQRFGVTRRYRTGPVAELRVRVELAARPAGGSALVYEVWAAPRGLAGRAVVPITIGRVARRRMEAAFRRYDRLALAGAPPEGEAGGRQGRLAPGGRERLTRLRVELELRNAPELAGRLAALVERGDDLALAHMRPYALADAWGADRRAVLELCLHATRAGLLELRWDVLCPLCRGAKESASTLAGVERDVHCGACNIDFSASLDRSVELTFRPNPAVRVVEPHDYCLGGPRVTPHVVAQQLLAPGERRTVRLALEPGRYRVRALGLPGSRHVAVAQDGPGQASFRATSSGWDSGELELAAAAAVAFVNETADERLFIAERTAWSDQAATAAEVTALQTFRDLFSSEVLRPGEEMSVGSVTIVFTDLRDSTRLYREIGDAPAYGSVVSHFDVLRDAIRREDGAVVKTIGDAVMAVFRRPISSLRAILAAQAELASPAEGERRLFLKAGIHAGPCIAVTLNERLDYFGSTVNAAARIVGLSSGDDVVVSEAVRSDPEVTEFLAADGALRIERVAAALKGFDDERFELWRVARNG